MKILLIDANLHHKNKQALGLYTNLHIVVVSPKYFDENGLTETFDCVYSPAHPIDVRKFPNTKFIFGPHFSVYPDNIDDLEKIKGNNSVYIMPSEWTVNVWKRFPVCENLNMRAVPFGVNIERFKPLPLTQRTKVFIYFKNRNPQDFHYIARILSSMQPSLELKVFVYGQYAEADYLSYLQESKYGIWIGCHESQGFGLEEALSMNVPLLVWSVRNMQQEYGVNHGDHYATTVPYWSPQCGEVFYSAQDFETSYNTFLTKLENGQYSPRAFILKHLSPQICEQRFIDTIMSINIAASV